MLWACAALRCAGATLSAAQHTSASSAAALDSRHRSAAAAAGLLCDCCGRGGCYASLASAWRMGTGGLRTVDPGRGGGLRRGCTLVDVVVGGGVNGGVVTFT
jgi:hypothetical protein